MNSSHPYIWNYLPLALQLLVAIGLATGMVAGSFFIGKKRQSKVKAGAYECGMEPIGDARGRFSVRFYMVAMLFILFDVEAVFMTGSRFFGLWEMVVYLAFVAVGLFYAWKKGVLDWANDKADL